MRLTISFFLLLGFFQASASVRDTSALLAQLDTMAGDTERVRVLRNLSSRFMEPNANRAIQYAGQVEALSMKLNYSLGHIWAYQLIGTYFGRKGDQSRRLYYLQKAHLAAEELPAPVEKAQLSRSLARTYIQLDRLEKAEKLLGSARSDFEDLGMKREEARLMMDYAILFQHREESEKAEEAYLEALRLAREERDSLLQAQCLANLGHLKQGMGDCAEAIPYLESSLSLVKAKPQYGGKAYIHAVLGGCYRADGNFQKALFHHRKSYEFAVLQGSFETMKLASEDVSLVLEKLGRTQESLEYSRISSAMRDSLAAQKESGRIRDLERQFELERRELEKEKDVMAREIAQIKALEKQERISRFLYIGIGLVGIAAIFLLLQTRHRKRVNESLEGKVADRTQALSQSNEQLSREILERKKTQEDLNTFIYKSSHDIKGPLTSIQGLLSLSRSARSEEEAQSMLDMADKKVIKLDFLLHRLIQHVELSERELQSETLPVFLLWRLVFKELKSMEGFDEVDFNVRCPENLEIETDGDAFRVILRGLLENVIMFRDPKKESNTARATLGMTVDGTFKLIVQDNGIGIPEGLHEKVFRMFFRGTLHSKGNGLGLYLVQRNVDRLGGKVNLESKVGTGTKITITLPQQANEKV